MKLSIIIPVYNVENYLDECVDSIVVQEEKNLEIILVDDGSTDNSGNACEQWAKRYEYIKVIHKRNGGLASARNAGLAIATGEFVLFIDSDDRIAKGSIGAIRKNILETNSDIYFLSAKKFYPDGNEEPLDDYIKRETISGKSDVEVMKQVASMTRYPGSACTKAYRKYFLDSNNLWFPFDRRIAEDLGFTLRCLLTAKTFDVVENDFYMYRQNRQGSITSSSTAINKSFWNLVIFIQESIELLSDNRCPKSVKHKYALGVVAYEYSVALVHFCRVTDRYEEAYQFMEETKWLSKFLFSKRGKVISFMIKLIGVKATSIALSYAYRRRERKNS